MTRTIISRLQFHRLQQNKMADKSRSDKLLAKGLHGITLGDIALTFIDKRQKRPTTLGWISLLIAGYFIVSALQRHGEHLNNMDINPKFNAAMAKKQDPQEKEFKHIFEENQKGSKPLKLPLFDMNKHKEDLHPVHAQKLQNQIKRYGYPHPKDFPVKMISKPQLSCPQEGILLLLIVASHPDNGGGRNAIRASWGVQDSIKYPSFARLQWKTIFVTGQSGKAFFDDSVLSEADQRNDLIVGDFQDTPHEDTRKFMLASKWVHEDLKDCKPKFIIKTKDDIYHNMVSIVNWLEARYPKESGSNLYLGKLLRLDRPVRDRQDPMYVPETDYPAEFFPNIIQGPLYLFSYKVFLKMASKLSAVTPIAMEDAYVGILADKVGTKPTENDHFQLLGKTGNVCHHLRMFFISPILPSEHVTIFKRVKQARVSGECASAQWVDKDGRHRSIDI